MQVNSVMFNQMVLNSLCSCASTAGSPATAWPTVPRPSATMRWVAISATDVAPPSTTSSAAGPKWTLPLVRTRPPHPLLFPLSPPLVNNKSWMRLFYFCRRLPLRQVLHLWSDRTFVTLLPWQSQRPLRSRYGAYPAMSWFDMLILCVVQKFKWLYLRIFYLLSWRFFFLVLFIMFVYFGCYFTVSHQMEAQYYINSGHQPFKQSYFVGTD